MSKTQWCVCCAVFGAFTFAPGIIARADDPFGDLDPSAVQANAADPATGEAPSTAAEKSILAAELTVGPAGADDPSEQVAQAHHDHEHGEAATEGRDFCRCIGESDVAAVERIEKALNGPLKSTGVDFTETPLEEVVNLLQEEFGIPIQLDLPAMEATGIDSTEQVTASLHNISLRSALRLMLKRLQLVYIIEDEVLLITTPEEAEASLLTCVYNVRGFMDDTSSKSVDALIDSIVSCVSTDSWAENGGGEAEIRPLKPGLLVISQTQAVHEEITSLLNAVREMRDSHAAAGDAAAATSARNEEQVAIRAYKLNIKQAGDLDQLRKQVRELIVQSFPDEQWDGRLADGQPVMLTVLGDRVIVRHKSTVQDAVEEVLTDSGVAISGDFCGGSGSGPGGIDGDGKRRSGLTGGGGSDNVAKAVTPGE